jgi:hypothetical protein
MLDVNTVSNHPTHFLRAVELIIQAREEWNVPSENWPYPTEYRFGIPNDNYYAEIFTDGMDWQPSYWILEEYKLRKPKIQPLMIFNNHKERHIFNDYDFGELFSAMFYYRRDSVWVNSKDLGYYTDTVWPFLSLFKNETRYKNLKLYAFEHASQPRVVFWLNQDFIPEIYRDIRMSDRKREAIEDGNSD